MAGCTLNKRASKHTAHTCRVVCANDVREEQREDVEDRKVVSAVSTAFLRQNVLAIRAGAGARLEENMRNERIRPVLKSRRHPTVSIRLSYRCTIHFALGP